MRKEYPLKNKQSIKWKIKKRGSRKSFVSS